MTTLLRFTTITFALLSAGACTSDGESDEGLGVPGEQTAPVVTTPPTTVPPVTTLPPAVTTAVPTTTAAPATTQAPATTAAPTTIEAPPTTVSTVTLYRSGDEGPEIAVLQLKLEIVGFLAPGYTVGLFDAATNQAVLDFQGQYGLIVDGIVGPETDTALTAAAVSVNPESS